MSKKNQINEAQFLAFLQRVLPQVVSDPHQVNAIYEKVATEVRINRSLEALLAFTEKGSIPDLEPETVKEFTANLVSNYGEANVVVRPAEDGHSLEFEVTTFDRVTSGSVKVVPPGSEASAEPEAPYVPFPYALPEDQELVWSLARRENLGPDEAVRALTNIEEEFWASKKGQHLQRQGVEKSFAEFIATVPAAALKESGIKRYHRDPETLKVAGAITETQPE